MPAPKWHTMTPAQRMTAGLCPECGADLSEEDAQHHLDLHWDPRLLIRDPESQANVRAKMLRNYIKEHKAEA
jgi:hypothetical protein